MPSNTDQQRRHWMSLAEARAEVAKHKFGDPSVHEIGTDDEPDAVRAYTRKQIEDADGLLHRALVDRKVVAYWRERSLDPQRTPIDASDLSDRRVWNFIIKARRPIRVLTNPALSALSSKTIELPLDDLVSWLEDLAPKSKAARNKGGRRTIADWEIVKDEVHRLMDYNGDFMPAEPNWDCQARVEEQISEFCQTRYGHEPSRSTVRRHVTSALNEWRVRRAQN